MIFSYNRSQRVLVAKFIKVPSIKDMRQLTLKDMKRLAVDAPSLAIAFPPAPIIYILRDNKIGYGIPRRLKPYSTVFYKKHNIILYDT